MGLVHRTGLGTAVEGANRLVNSAELRGSLRALNSTLEEIQNITCTVNKQLATDVQTMVRQAAKTLTTAERVLSSDSPINRDLRRTLAELAGASRSIRVLADYLERHPDAMIYGKGCKP